MLAPEERAQAGCVSLGHPLLIARSLLDALRAADPIAGAKPIVRAYASPAGDLEIAEALATLGYARKVE